MEILKKNSVIITVVLFIGYFAMNLLGEGVLLLGLGMDHALSISSFFSNVFGFAISMFPALLLAIYLFAFAKKSPSHPLLAVYYVISILLSVTSVFSFINTIIQMLKYSPLSAIQQVINLLFVVVGMGLMVFCAIDVVRKFEFIKITRICVAVYYGANIIKIMINTLVSLFSGYIRLYTIGNFIMSFASVLLGITFIVMWWLVFSAPQKNVEVNKTDVLNSL